MSTNPLPCEEFYRRALSYLWRETNSAQIDAINEHRLTCPDCDAYFLAAEDALCQEIYRQIPAYMDGELPASDIVQVGKHLAVCDRCRAHFRFDGEIRDHLVDRLRQFPLKDQDIERIANSVRERIRSDLRRSS